MSLNKRQRQRVLHPYLPTNMLAQILFVAVTLAVNMASAAVVTVYHLSYIKPQSEADIYPSIDVQGSIALSPLPTPVENGMTKYEEKFIVSRIIMYEAHTTETLYSSLFTRTGEYLLSSCLFPALLTFDERSSL